MNGLAATDNLQQTAENKICNELFTPTQISEKNCEIGGAELGKFGGFCKILTKIYNKLELSQIT